MMRTMDIDGVTARAQRASSEALQGLRDCLEGLLTPVRDKALALDFEAIASMTGESVQVAISKYCESVDVQAIIDSLALTLVQTAQASIPEMIQGAGADIEAERDRLIEKAREDPIGTFLGIAAHGMANKTAAQPGPQNGAGGGQRTI